jgi:hypothetical protein
MAASVPPIRNQSFTPLAMVGPGDAASSVRSISTALAATLIFSQVPASATIEQAQQASPRTEQIVSRLCEILCVKGLQSVKEIAAGPTPDGPNIWVVAINPSHSERMAIYASQDEVIDELDVPDAYFRLVWLDSPEQLGSWPTPRGATVRQCL